MSTEKATEVPLLEGINREGAALRSANQQQEPKLPRERPILFSSEMVRAILDGRKTQTRRVVTDFTSQGNWKASELDLSRAWVDPGPSPAGNRGPYLKSYVRFAPLRARGWEDEPDTIVDRLYPRWFPEDRLWVRETFCPVDDRDHGGEQWVDYRATPRYSAEHPAGWDAAPEDCEALKWRPSIHMPRTASRITLEVTGVRVERVQDICGQDAIAEGIERRDDYYLGGPHRRVEGKTKVFTLAWQAYKDIWNNLNAKRGYGWDVNPWVWVIEFRPCS